MHSAKLYFPTAWVLFFGIPVSQLIYWKVLDVAVGARPLDRNPRPDWPAGQGLLDKIE